ncbi:MAG: ATP-binding protein [Desulfitobacterium hafniense]|nr:ATP-binding protein [Desulfitobacterium hafniense]
MQISRGKVARAQKVVVYGPEGIGKSSFLAKFPGIIFDDTEGSTLHMDVARTPKSSSWTMLLEHIRYFIKNPHKLNTFGLDTADWAEKLCAIELCAKANKDGIEGFGYGKGYTYLAEEFGKLLNLLEELIEVGVNVVIAAHAFTRKFDQPDEMGSYDRWELKLTKYVAPMVREWADMVLFANYETYVVKTDDKKNKAQGGKRVMHTAHHPCWDAKNRHDLAIKLPFDFKEIAHCIPVITSTTSQKQTVNYLDDQPSKTPEVKNPEPPPEIKETPKQDLPKQEEIKLDPPKQDLTGVPKPLADLIIANEVTVEEIQQAVSSKGYYPKNTPIENYDPNFVNGVLVRAWVQVFQMIKDFRDDVPF